MAKVRRITGVSGTGMALRGKNIDTDRIIPARYMKVTRFDTLGEFAFYDERFDKKGTLLEHPLNDTRFAGARFLIVQSNFGSGSSREHAPQALMRYGFQAFIGESFAEIFQGNCLAMGLPIVTLPAAKIAELLDAVEAQPQIAFALDIEQKRLTATAVEGGGTREYAIEMDAGARMALMSGSWDSTSSLMHNLDGIHATAERIPYLHNFRR